MVPFGSTIGVCDGLVCVLAPSVWVELGTIRTELDPLRVVDDLPVGNLMMVVGTSIVLVVRRESLLVRRGNEREVTTLDLFVGEVDLVVGEVDLVLDDEDLVLVDGSTVTVEEGLTVRMKVRP